MEHFSLNFQDLIFFLGQQFMKAFKASFGESDSSDDLRKRFTELRPEDYR